MILFIELWMERCVDIWIDVHFFLQSRKPNQKKHIDQIKSLAPRNDKLVDLFMRFLKSIVSEQTFFSAIVKSDNEWPGFNFTWSATTAIQLNGRCEPVNCSVSKQAS